MSKFTSAAVLAATAFICSTSLAGAHASLTPNKAQDGTSVRLAVSIPHGCDGAPVDRVLIKLPEGFISAKPQVKAGWAVEITNGDYAKSYTLHDKAVTSGALEVTWSGGAIPDDQFDEFVVRGSLQGFDAEAKLPFPVIQFCGDASVGWVEVAAEGQDAHSLEHPAPLFTVLPAETAGHAQMDHAQMQQMQPGMMHDMTPEQMSEMMQGMTPEQTQEMMTPAAGITVGALSLSGAFTRATLPSAMTAGGYLAITNTGTEADRLVAASSPAAAQTGLHQMKMEGDQMMMTEIDGGIEIPAGETVTLAPGGLHIMFMGLKAPFIEGQTVPVTLVFEKAGTVELELPVGAVGAASAGHAGH